MAYNRHWMEVRTVNFLRLDHRDYFRTFSDMGEMKITCVTFWSRYYFSTSTAVFFFLCLSNKSAHITLYLKKCKWVFDLLVKMPTCRQEACDSDFQAWILTPASHQGGRASDCMAVIQAGDLGWIHSSALWRYCGISQTLWRSGQRNRRWELCLSNFLCLFSMLLK